MKLELDLNRKDLRELPWAELGFLNLATPAILSRMVVCFGGCPVHCRILNSIPGLYPPGTSSVYTSPSPL